MRWRESMDTKPTLVNKAWIQEHLDQPMRRRSAFKTGSPRIQLANGGKISVQASARHYCSPKENTGPYVSVEILPELKGKALRLLRDESTSDNVVWGWVAIETVVEMINQSGGVA